MEHGDACIEEERRWNRRERGVREYGRRQGETGRRGGEGSEERKGAKEEYTGEEAISMKNWK